ncbi:MAG: class I SAM-dependent methyltransferase [Bacteroidales bacterium]|nr:class I SAM-dependent methyltransferase [Bacteroidales bacterium]
MSDLQFIFRYINYKIFSKSKKGHDVHSPFVFDFIAKVLGNYATYKSQYIKNILSWHESLTKNKDKINICEIGAGSRKETKGSVKVNSLVKKTGIRPRYGQLLWRILYYYKPEAVIEFGTGMGVSTAYLAGSLPDVKVHTVEGDAERLVFAQKEFRKLGLKNIIGYNENFDDFITKSNFKKNNYAIFLDGNHRQEPTIRYFNYFVNICDENSFIILDDINWSGEMREAWKIIKDHPLVSISIDLFFIGIVFFRKGIPKQGFVLNF